MVFRVLATVQGRQLKRIVRTRDEAELLAAQWRDGQANSLVFLPTRFGPDQLRDAEAAQRIVETLGISLLDAATFVLRNYKTGANNVPSLTDAVDQFLLARADRSPSHLKSLRNTLHRLRAFVGKKDLGVVQSCDVSRWLDKTTVGRAPKTFNTLLEGLNAFFNWSVEKGWLLHSPTRGVERKRIVRQLPVVMSPKQAAELMADVERNWPELVPYFSLALFGGVRAGVREGESNRLDAKLRSGASVFVAGGVKIWGKTGSERLLRWNCPLKAFLDAYPLNRFLLPGGEHAASALISKIRKKHNLSRNVLRHSAITGMALMLDSIVQTGLACDTSETVIRRNYLGQWSRQEAVQFYKIRPIGRAVQSRDAAA